MVDQIAAEEAQTLDSCRMLDVQEDKAGREAERQRLRVLQWGTHRLRVVHMG